MKKYILHFSTLFALLSLFACGRIEHTVTREPAHLTLTWEEPYDRAKIAERQSAIPPELKQKLNEIGDNNVTSEITISNTESKQTFKVEFVLGERDADTTQLLTKVKAILNDRPFKVTLVGEKVTRTTRF